MKNEEVRAMIAKQYDLSREQVFIEFIAHDKNGYEFKAKVLNKDLSINTRTDIYEDIKVTVKYEPWINDPFIM